MQQETESGESWPRVSLNRGFFGREHELSELLDALSQTLAGNGKSYVVMGEPGVGKSWLLKEFASLAHGRGARVLWTSALREPDAVASHYWLWERLLSEAAGAEAVGNDPDAEAAEIAAVKIDGAQAYELPARAVNGSHLFRGPQAPNPGIFEITLERLATVARRQPLVIVLDDLGAADHLSLLALEFIIPHLPRIPIMVTAACREAEIRRGVGAACSRALRGSRMLPLRALSMAELACMIEERTGRTPLGADVERVMKLTLGNPLFVELLLRCRGLPDGDEIRNPLPPVIAAAAEEHLLTLSESTREILAVASVLGRNFEVPVLRALADCAPAALLDGLTEAETAGVLQTQDGAPACYRFRHPLVWRALYDSLPGSRRRRLHHEAARFIEQNFVRGRDRLDVLARHFYEGIPIGDARKAADYCCDAGDVAMKDLRFRAAARFYTMAVSAASLDAPDELRRCELLVKAAEALSAAGNLAKSVKFFEQASELAEAHGDCARFAQAALGCAGCSIFARSRPDGETVALLTRALGAVRDEYAALRVRLLLRLAAEFGWHEGAQARWRDLECEAERIVRSTGDPDAEFAFLVYRHLFVLCAPESACEQLANTTEMIRVALSSGRAEDCITALVCAYGSILRKGDISLPLPEMALAPARDSVPGDRVLRVGYRYYTAIRSLLEGRFEEAARLVCALGVLRDVNALWPSLVFALRELGRLEELEPVAEQAVEQCPGVPVLRALAMKIHWRLGKQDLARNEFERLAAADFRDVPRDLGFLVCLSALSAACAELKDRRRAVLLYGMLEPYRSMNAACGPLIFFGPVSFYLGVLSDVMGNPEQAQVHFETALASCRRLKARAWEAYVLHAWARMLDGRDDPAGREKARSLAGSALVIAEEMGMSDLRRRLTDARGAAAGTLPSPEYELRVAKSHPERAGSENAVVSCTNGAPNRGKSTDLASDAIAGDTWRAATGDFESALVAEWVFAREGDYWTLSFKGKVIRLKHTRGVAYLASLLEFPGREFYAADLVAGADGANPAEAMGSAVSFGSEGLQVGPAGRERRAQILDARARAAYSSRLQELRGELDEARSFNDAERASKIEREISFITSEIVRAAGFGGAGPRAFGSANERARINVTNAIRSVLQKLRQQHPELRRYLATTVRTGTLCSFQPDPRFPGVWRVSKRS